MSSRRPVTDPAAVGYVVDFVGSAAVARARRSWARLRTALRCQAPNSDVFTVDLARPPGPEAIIHRANRGGTGHLRRTT